MNRQTNIDLQPLDWLYCGMDAYFKIDNNWHRCKVVDVKGFFARISISNQCVEELVHIQQLRQINFQK